MANKKLQMFSLNQQCKDKATGRKITLTHAVLTPMGVMFYLAQPDALNPKTGRPVDTIRVTPDRVVDGKAEDISVPLEVIGTKVTDKATGMKGVVTTLVMHPGNCLHATVLPAGLADGNETPECVEIDIRRLKGPAIVEMTAEERKASEKKSPSPSSCVLTML